MAISYVRPGRGFGNVSSVGVDMIEEFYARRSKTLDFRPVPIDSARRCALAYAGFRESSARFARARDHEAVGSKRAPSIQGESMAEARRMGKSELFSHFAERFEVKRTQAREFFDELTTLAEKELKRSGEFTLPNMSLVKKQLENFDPVAL